MLFSSISNLNTYAKNFKMQQKWQIRQQEMKNPLMQMQGGVSSPIQSMQVGGKRRYSVEGLTNKLQMGKKLSAEEMEFLRENAPELYIKAVRIMKEREAYERQLKSCKTKEDVRRLNLSVISSAAPQGKAGAGSQDWIMTANALNDEHRSFVGSGEYRDLPDNWKEMEDHKKVEGIRKKKKPSQGGEELQLIGDKQMKPDFMPNGMGKEGFKLPGIGDKEGLEEEGSADVEVSRANKGFRVKA